jgi:hypothetical protein
VNENEEKHRFDTIRLLERIDESTSEAAKRLGDGDGIITDSIYWELFRTKQELQKLNRKVAILVAIAALIALFLLLIAAR